MTRTVISGGQVIDPASAIDVAGDLVVADGVVVSIEPAGSVPRSAVDTWIDAAGCLVCPGFIDSHVSLREPGFEEDEITATGTAAALAGGFTSVAAQSDTDPVVDNRSSAEFVRLQAERAGNCRVFPLGAVTKSSKGEELAEIGQLVAGGAVGFSDAKRPVANSEVMRRALEYTQMFNRPILHFPIVPELAEGGVMHEGFEATRLGLRGIPAAAQDIMVGRDIALVQLTGGRLHLMCITTEDSVERIRAAQKRGLRITADVTPHHLFLTDREMGKFDTMYKCYPPLRSDEHIHALIEGLRDGTISCISADHQPVALEKKAVELDISPPGICGLETLLPICIKALIEPGHLSWSQLIARLTIGPAEVLNLPLGRLSSGAPADVVVIDPREVWKISAAQFSSRSRNTPFDGLQVRGRVVMTMVGGKVKYQTRPVSSFQ